MTEPNIWVIRNDDESWGVRREGDDGLLSQHDTQASAIDAARSLAKETSVELIWQGADGKIQGRSSFGNDPADVPG